MKELIKDLKSIALIKTKRLQWELIDFNQFVHTNFLNRRFNNKAWTFVQSLWVNIILFRCLHVLPVMVFVRVRFSWGTQKHCSARNTQSSQEIICRTRPFCRIWRGGGNTYRIFLQANKIECTTLKSYRLKLFLLRFKFLQMLNTSF